MKITVKNRPKMPQLYKVNIILVIISKLCVYILGCLIPLKFTGKILTFQHMTDWWYFSAMFFALVLHIVSGLNIWFPEFLWF